MSYPQYPQNPQAGGQQYGRQGPAYPQQPPMPGYPPQQQPQPQQPPPPQSAPDYSQQYPAAGRGGAQPQQQSHSQRYPVKAALSDDDTLAASLKNLQVNRNAPNVPQLPMPPVEASGGGYGGTYGYEDDYMRMDQGVGQQQWAEQQQQQQQYYDQQQQQQQPQPQYGAPYGGQDQYGAPMPMPPMPQHQPQQYPGYPPQPASSQQVPSSGHAGVGGGAAAAAPHPPMPGMSGSGPAYGQPHPQQTLPPRPVIPPHVKPVDPLFMAACVEAMPVSESVRSASKLTCGVVIQPLARTSEALPVVNFGAMGVVRCAACRAYINPYCYFFDGGSRWRCNICLIPNDVPAKYHASLDANGYRTDNRPELTLSSYEIVASAEYMMRAPMPPTFVFVIDVSRRAVETGMVAAVASSILQLLDTLPGDSRTMVGFVTFNSTVHYYALRPGAHAPHAHVMPDVEDLFVPVPTDLLVNLRENRALVVQLLESLQALSDRSDVESAAGPALEAATHLMSVIGGKLMLFTTSLPSLGVGRLQNRENPQLLGGAQEHMLLQPADEHYRKKAVKLTRFQVCADTYHFAHDYVDVATVSELSRYTGGETRLYPGFSAYNNPAHAEKLHMDLARSFGRECGWESVVRVRITKGAKLENFHGNYFIRGTDLLALPCADADKAYAMEVRLDNNQPLGDLPSVSVQAALLYTTSSGERRIRVHNMALPVVRTPAEMYAAVNGRALMNLLAKEALEVAVRGTLHKARDYVRGQMVDILRSARAVTGNFQAYGGALPANLAVLPPMALALLKNEVLREGNQVGSDTRSAAMGQLRTMGLSQMDLLLRPRMVPLHELAGQDGLRDPDSGFTVMPPEMPLRADVMWQTGCYLVDDGQHLVVWVGREVDPRFLLDVFGVPAFASLPGNLRAAVRVPQVGEPPESACQRVNNVIDGCRQMSSVFQQVSVVRDGDSNEFLFRDLLVDEFSNLGMSLHDFERFIFQH